MDIHSLNDLNYPGIYVNHFGQPNHTVFDSEPFESKSDALSCGEVFSLEVDVRFDEQLCKRYGDLFHVTQTVLAEFMKKTKIAIRQSTCVDVKVIDIFGSCTGFTNIGQFSWDSMDSKSIMSTIKKNFYSLELPNVQNFVPNKYRDIGLVFSGLKAGSLAGATYRSQACGAEYGYAWVSGLNDVALNHEFGHALGANHDTHGIMRADLRVGDDIGFSERSKGEMIRFVNRDPRSWCLRRELSSIDEIKESDHWSDGIIIERLAIDGKNAPLVSMALGSLTEESRSRRSIYKESCTQQVSQGCPAQVEIRTGLLQIVSEYHEKRRV